MKRIVFFGGWLILVSGFIISCNEVEKEGKEEKGDVKKQVVEPDIDFCTCLDSLPENVEACATFYPVPQTEQDSIDRTVMIKNCLGEEITMMDTLTKVEKDSAQAAYENDLSLEIKEIEEEKEDPISDECKAFLEEYADAIKSFASLADKIEANPDDINLMIARPEQEEYLYSFASKPQMFQCSQNEAFKKQVEILNNKRDKLLAN
ncbi:hypothetical protein [Parvicella tangerina]|uniref:Uncharacterized protein n=1 Tax=Parvicella tangerina TaxID=2829795 RepID=A0A916NSV8_9FLAO|nr:hypothetical protein [Parvicella tangerina]CAG5084595.1 hypothetical protein CRYO30217_02515 [Parvicella tangerina]